MAEAGARRRWFPHLSPRGAWSGVHPIGSAAPGSTFGGGMKAIVTARQWDREWRRERFRSRQKMLFALIVVEILFFALFGHLLMAALAVFLMQWAVMEIDRFRRSGQWLCETKRMIARRLRLC